MRRREFITLFGAVGIVWPHSLLGQERKKIQLVGVLANEAWPPLDGWRHVRVSDRPESWQLLPMTRPPSSTT
jgi:hypothetical protein